MITFTLDDGRVVGQTRALRQRTIEALLEVIGSQYPGQTVTANYPPDYEQRLAALLRKHR